MVISESQSPDLPFTYLLVAGAFVYGGQREHLKGVGSLLIQCGFSGSTSMVRIASRCLCSLRLLFF